MQEGKWAARCIHTLVQAGNSELSEGSSKARKRTKSSAFQGNALHAGSLQGYAKERMEAEANQGMEWQRQVVQVSYQRNGRF
eukprot:12323585-Ditylum_brightwellii.AAC.1